MPAAPAARSIYIPPWRVDVALLEGVPRALSAAALARLCARALGAAGAPSPASLALLLAGDRELTELNLVHMGKRGPTDVLSFPLLDASAFARHEGQPARAVPRPGLPFRLPPRRRLHLGDVAVSVERAAEQAAHGHGGQTGDVSWSLAEELALLVVHGVLHVCGWDHAEPGEEMAMRALERRILVGQ